MLSVVSMQWQFLDNRFKNWKIVSLSKVISSLVMYKSLDKHCIIRA